MPGFMDEQNDRALAAGGLGCHCRGETDALHSGHWRRRIKNTAEYEYSKPIPFATPLLSGGAANGNPLALCPAASAARSRLKKCFRSCRTNLNSMLAFNTKHGVKMGSRVFGNCQRLSHTKSQSSQHLAAPEQLNHLLTTSDPDQFLIILKEILIKDGKGNLEQKFSLFNDYWHPRIVGDLNDSFRQARQTQGEFIWHLHEKEDELFVVIKGKLAIRFRDHQVELNEGEFLIIPMGLNTCPSRKEVHFYCSNPNHGQHR
jgi:mannose-6-phosphate isomerase-like protein (cupin superfamily)